MTTNFFCAMYPNLNKLSDGALDHARVIISSRLTLERDDSAFKRGFSYGDHVEAMAMICLEEDYRWENGGKQAFDECIQRTFGRPSTQG